MRDIKAEQFDPAHKEYIQHAWCAGPMDFRHASHRGHEALAKNEWVITFLKTGEHIAVTDATYQAYFAEPAGPSIIQKYLASDAELPAAETDSTVLSEAETSDWEPACAGAVAGENPQPGKSADDSSDSPSSELASDESFNTSSEPRTEDYRPARNKRRS